MANQFTTHLLTNLFTMRPRDRYLIGALISFGIGFTQLVIFFPDNEPIIIFLLIGVASMLGSVLLGVLVPGVWVLFCVAACWGSTLVGLTARSPGGRLGFYLIGVTVATAFLGGAIGAVCRSRLNRMY